MIQKTIYFNGGIGIEGGSKKGFDAVRPKCHRYPFVTLDPNGVSGANAIGSVYRVSEDFKEAYLVIDRGVKGVVSPNRVDISFGLGQEIHESVIHCERLNLWY